MNVFKLETISGVIGYWSTVFAVIVLMEHFIFRKNNFDFYNVAETWNEP